MPNSESEPKQKELWVKTRDGSLSCREPMSGLLCHNWAGAFLEATQNYAIPSGLDWSKLMEAQTKKHPFRILDSCYGLGYNTWALIDRLFASYPESALEVLDSSDQSKLPLLQCVAIEKSADMLKMSADVFAQQGFGNLHKFISPLEHNAYYRTLSHFLENGMTRFKVALVQVRNTEVDPVHRHDTVANPADVLKTENLVLGFQFYIWNENDDSWLPFAVPFDR